MTGFRGYINLPPEPNPTAMQLVCLIECVNVGSDKAAARRLGLSPRTVRNHLSELYLRIGAESRPHAVALLWPVIGHALLPRVRQPDRRLGVERRSQPAGVPVVRQLLPADSPRRAA